MFICYLLLVASWGVNKGSKRAFRPAMALSSGELSGLGGKFIMMMATATPKTIRVLKNQLPEITKWRNLISPPLRRNVVTIVPPPEVLSSKVEVLLAPFIHDMRINQTPYLILVRGTNFQLFPLCILNFFPLLISRHKQRNPHLSPPFENCE